MFGLFLLLSSLPFFCSIVSGATADKSLARVGPFPPSSRHTTHMVGRKGGLSTSKARLPQQREFLGRKDQDTETWRNGQVRMFVVDVFVDSGCCWTHSDWTATDTVVQGLAVSPVPPHSRHERPQADDGPFLSLSN
ncbi:hypothetical protein LZ31DRAFT_553054 [Colletotrichum somersetense]|nr:hypothetical protein LZ31DRAFT_553054 [Colletotrichum somersetense]